MKFGFKSKRVLLSSETPAKPATVIIQDEKFLSIEPYEFKSKGLKIIDFGNSVVMPGIVDTHTHINEPGRTEWEGFETACQAAAVGGITTVIDMPLNSIPATTTLNALKIKQNSALGKCYVDYGFWGGVVPGNSRELEPMVREGVFGFKCFMIDSGVSEFPMSEETDLREAMPILAKLGVPLLAHAELESKCSVSKIDHEEYSWYLNSRPQKWEVDAIQVLAKLCEEYRCHTHVVHLSAANALQIIKKAKESKLSLSVETCPHYLTLLAEDISNGATQFKCAPPIREKVNQERLWKGLETGIIDFVVSDHSPCVAKLKNLDTGDFNTAWGGISGLQLTLPLVWTECKKRKIKLENLVKWLCIEPAKLLGLSETKGQIKSGLDADFIVFDPEKSFVVTPKKLKHKNPMTPYEGKSLHGMVEKTFLRGNCIFENGRLSSKPMGAMLKRNSREMRVSQTITDMVELASERVGGKVVFANDDFFAPKENLLKFEAPVFIPDKYTENGKWMDGWESRRKRGPGHDWCIVKLGMPGVISSVNVDTSYFTGNYPESCSIEGCESSEVNPKKAKWVELVSKAKLSGGSHNIFSIRNEGRFTHLRLNIFPDGGVARLRVYGQVKPDWHKLKAAKLIDLAALENGARAISAADMFFGHKDNLILPGRAKNMGEGWETRRRRGPGHDWIIVKLGSAGKVNQIEVDTNHFKGNFPDTCSIEACYLKDEPNLPADFRDRSDIRWQEILPKTKLQAHKQHVFRKELKNINPKYNYIRLNIFPDGGVSRLRVFGVPS